MYPYWFKPKRFWKICAAYHPVSWQGFVVTIGLLLLAVSWYWLAVNPISYWLGLTILALIFDLACLQTGEYPQWWLRAGQTQPSQPQRLIRWLVAGILIVAGCNIIAQQQGWLVLELQPDPIVQACTEEAKFCPDGSAVGRTGPNCTFAPCPVDTTQWENFVKPNTEELKQLLTPLQYEVTQEEGTETPYDNTYEHTTDEGMYVDIVSGEPLFSSQDKYDSGTGWPSFVKPISEDAVVLVEDTLLFIPRTEVRSRYADSHLGHVFNDGPKDRGGKRYCMNSAALRFVPKAKMAEEGYGDFLVLFE